MGKRKSAMLVFRILEILRNYATRSKPMKLMRILERLDADYTESVDRGTLKDYISEISGEEGDDTPVICEGRCRKGYYARQYFTDMELRILINDVLAARQIEENIAKREERLKAEQELAQLLRERKTAMQSMQDQINQRMRELYDTITGKKETSAPVLTINEDKTASFETPGNTSEGAAFKGLVIYDLALLSLSEHCTPALIHDSNILSRIEADYLAPILEQYRTCGYQVFASIDKPKETSPEAQRILFDHPLLQLAAGDGQELYGRSWSKL